MIHIVDGSCYDFLILYIVNDDNLGYTYTYDLGYTCEYARFIEQFSDN